MMRVISSMVVAAFPLLMFGQAAWIEPDPTSIEFNPSSEVTIFVDANMTECPDLADYQDVYLWTWSPAELPAGDPFHNGEWGESNEALKMTVEGGGIFSFTLIPTEFYQVDAATVFENDFSFLIKLRNGAGGATSCNEDKSEDLMVSAEPFVLDRKVYSFPDTNGDTLATSPSDFFTLIYNSNLEEDLNLVGSEGFNVFLKALDEDGQTYTYASPTQLDNFEELRMVERDNGVYYWTVRPSEILSGMDQPFPSDKTIQSLRLQIAKTGAQTGADLVGGTYDFIFRCP